MQIYRNLTDHDDSARGAVIAVGNFDGVHRGHQALLNRAGDIAREQGKPLAVLTFEPHPRRLFRPDEPPARITPAGVKARRLKERGTDILFSLPFDWDFASQSAEDFVQHILIDALNAAHVVVGYDFCFGQLRQGSADTIRAAGLPVTSVDKMSDGDDAISSSRIRQNLRAGEIAQANALLGWDWEIEGAIFRGDRRGHDLGYPTANVLLGDTLHPAYGVYAAEVQIEGEDIWRPSATNIGIRPMFAVTEGQVEAHILDFEDRDIYGRLLRIRPVRRLRSEARFDGLPALIAQMEKDCTRTREILGEKQGNAK